MKLKPASEADREQDDERQAVEQRCRRTSAPPAPPPRDIGSERKRSIRPFLTSSASPSAVTNPPKAIDWTMMPGHQEVDVVERPASGSRRRRRRRTAARTSPAGSCRRSAGRAGAGSASGCGCASTSVSETDMASELMRATSSARLGGRLLLGRVAGERMNTSSSVGRRIDDVVDRRPPRRRAARTASAIVPRALAHRRRARRPSSSIGRAVGRSRRARRSRARRRRASARRDARAARRRRWSLSSSDVPSAITLPWSITTIRSARRSASSRYCVVSSTVVPRRDARLDRLPHARRLRGSSPVVGSSRNRTGGRHTSAAARSSRRRMPPE